MNHLPNELFLQVTLYLHLIDLQSLAGVNKRLAILTRPQRFSALRLNRNLSEVIAEVRKNPGKFEYVKELILDFPSGFRVADHEAALWDCLQYLPSLDTIAWPRQRESPVLLRTMPTNHAHRIKSLNLVQNQTFMSVTPGVLPTHPTHRQVVASLNGDMFPNVEEYTLHDLWHDPRFDIHTIVFDHFKTFSKLRSLIIFKLDSEIVQNLCLPHLEDVSIGYLHLIGGRTDALSWLLLSPRLTRFNLRSGFIREPLHQWLQNKPTYSRLLAFRLGGLLEPAEQVHLEVLAAFLTSHPSIMEFGWEVANTPLPITLRKTLPNLTCFAGNQYYTGAYAGESLLRIEMLPHTLYGLELRGGFTMVILGLIARTLPNLRYICGTLLEIQNKDDLPYEDPEQEKRRVKTIASWFKQMEWIEDIAVWRVIRDLRSNESNLFQVENIGIGVRHPWAPREPRLSVIRM